MSNWKISWQQGCFTIELPVQKKARSWCYHPALWLYGCLNWNLELEVPSFKGRRKVWNRGKGWFVWIHLGGFSLGVFQGFSTDSCVLYLRCPESEEISDFLTCMKISEVMDGPWWPYVLPANEISRHVFSTDKATETNVPLDVFKSSLDDTGYPQVQVEMKFLPL